MKNMRPKKSAPITTQSYQGTPVKKARNGSTWSSQNGTVPHHWIEPRDSRTAVVGIEEDSDRGGRTAGGRRAVSFPHRPPERDS